jgi:sugar O-acyltransferase (sialic acid O-acetyltransferase NeuD family)
MKKLYAVYGFSGFGREICPVLQQQLQREVAPTDEYEVVYVDDSATEVGMLNGTEVHNFESFLKEPADEKYAVIAIANSGIREKLTIRCDEAGIKQFAVRADNVVELDNVEIGEGSILCPFVTLTSDVKIGKSFHANIYSYVAHDCVIGDYVTFAPRVNCNGNIHIEDHAYIGTGAVFKQGTPKKPLIVGKGAVVAAGAVVTKNVPPGKTVFGNPAVPLTRANLEARKDRG